MQNGKQFSRNIVAHSELITSNIFSLHFW